MRNLLLKRKITKNIKNIYEKNLFFLPLKTQFHFALRLYRITGNKKYILPILNYSKVILPQTILMIEKFSKRTFLKMLSERLFFSLPSFRKIFKERKKFFKKRKELLYYFRLIENLYLLKNFGFFETPYKSFFEKGLNSLSKIKFDEILFEKKLFSIFSTQIINYVYYLNDLKIADFQKKLLENFHSFFLKEKNETFHKFQNKIYGLTHFIICDSHYYQKFASKRKNEWILKIFEKEISKILKTNVDLVAEVGLCFKLCRKSSFGIEMIEKYLIREFSWKLKYYPYGGKNLARAEHRNILTYMFLRGFKKLYPGPNLRKYFL